MKFFLLFITIPIIEIIIFLKVNTVIGIFNTVSIIIATALVGTLLVQKQGKEIILQLKNIETNPVLLMGNGLFIVIAGILLLTPGFITDIIGFSLLVAPIRQKALNYFSNKIKPN